MRRGSVKDKVVVVTGATSGIGWHTALAFAARGAKVVGTGRDPGRLAALAEHVDHVLTLDVTDPEQVEVARAAVLDRHGGVDVLVNNAGVGLFKAWDETSEAELRRVLEVDFFGAVRMAQAFLPSIVTRGGVLAQVASVAARRGYPRHAAYCAAKFALLGWTEAVRRDLSRTAAHLTVICPPAVRTPFFENAGFVNFEREHPGLRMWDPADVAQEIVSSVEERRRIVIVSQRSRILDSLNFLSPRLLDTLLTLR